MIQDASIYKIYFNMVSEEKYRQISSILEKKTKIIWEYENKSRIVKGEKELEMYQYGFSIADCFNATADGITFYFVFNYSFLNIVSNKILSAIDKYPSSFGTGNAQDVIDALYKLSKMGLSQENYISYLQDFACCYILYEYNNAMCNNILRVDLLRYMKDNETTHKKEFVGGLLHSLKHFSKDGKNLSVGKDVNDVSKMDDILIYIGRAFIECGQNKPKDNTVEILIKDGKCMRFAFYCDTEKETYYLKTAYRI